MYFTMFPYVWQNDVAFVITSNLHACQSYVYQEVSCMRKPYIGWPLQAEHPSSTSLTNSYSAGPTGVPLY